MALVSDENLKVRSYVITLSLGFDLRCELVPACILVMHYKSYVDIIKDDDVLLKKRDEDIVTKVRRVQYQFLSFDFGNSFSLLQSYISSF